MITGYPVLKVFSTVPLVQHRAVSLIRVDLRFPEHMPVTIMDPDPDSAVISRFRIPESQNSGLPAEKTTYQQACACNHPALFLVSGVWQGKRQETLSRDITAQQRYLVLARISPFLLRWRR